MNRSRSSGKLETESHRHMSDEQLYKLILRAYEETRDLEQLQMTIKGIMIDDPERIRVAYRRVVEMKGRSRTNSEQHLHMDPPQKPLPLAPALQVESNISGSSSSSRSSQRRKSTPKAGIKGMQVVIDATGMREFGGLESLKCEMSALCRIQHQNLLNLVSFSVAKGNRFSLDFDLANASHVTLLDMFQEELEGRSLNGCEVACVLAQVSLGMLFLLDLVAPLLEPMELNPLACLLTENIILTDRGLIKLCGHHPVLRLPRQPCAAAAVASSPLVPAVTPPSAGDDRDRPRPEQLRTWPGLLAQQVAMLLYELDHPSHQALQAVQRCSTQERQLLDKRYAKLFTLCADWDPGMPADLRTVLYSDFINEQTSAIASYQIPLEIVFASRFR